jgi:hypothetical protein
VCCQEQEINDELEFLIIASDGLWDVVPFPDFGQEGISFLYFCRPAFVYLRNRLKLCVAVAPACSVAWRAF